MRFPIKAAAGAAAVGSAINNDTGCGAPAGGSKILMSTAGQMLVYNYDGAAFTTAINHSVAGTDPSWMAFAEPNLLFAVDEWSSTMSLYDINLAANTVELVEQVNGSSGVVHLEFNPERTRMLGSAYGGGGVDVWDIEGGKLELLKTIPSDGALGPNELRQAAPHPHQAINDPSGRYFAVNDLGTDEIMIIDSADDAFEVVNHVRVQPAGCGPRHGAFFPERGSQATHYVVVCEIVNRVLVYQLVYGTDEGISFTLVDNKSTFDPASPPANATTTAAAGELMIAPFSNDVYVSNRLTGEDTDSIAHFKLNRWNGRLTFVEEFSSGGLLPRMFSFTNWGDDLLIATQDGANAVTALRRSKAGSVDEAPSATLAPSVFGEPGFGPKFIQQIA